MWKTLWRKTPHFSEAVFQMFCRIKNPAFAAFRQARRTFPQFPPPLLRLLLKKIYIHLWIVSAAEGKRAEKKRVVEGADPYRFAKKPRTNRRGDHRSPAAEPIYLRLPCVKGGAAERRRRDCYRAKEQPLSRLTPTAPLAQGSRKTTPNRRAGARSRRTRAQSI